MVSEWPEDWAPLLSHLESRYPEEGCGIVARGPQGARIIPLANVYDRYHARDPERFPRTARTAYLFDPKEFMVVQEALDASGETLSCVIHSHVDVGAYFSEEDRVSAAPDGEPLLPGVSYLVVAVDQGRTTGARCFHWENGQYVERPFDAAAFRR